jgi:type IV pilus assembly protein PilV
MRVNVRDEQSGFTMIEVLVTIAILVVGLLGLAAMQTLSTLAELESYQRSQALVLVRDMGDRMTANKSQITNYLVNNSGLAPEDCGPVTPIPPSPGDYRLDLCEWNNLLNGASEKADGGAKNVGAMIGARGCVVRLDPVTFLVTVAWQGLSRAGIPKEACGQGAYGDDQNRRTVSMVVRLGLLDAP